MRLTAVPSATATIRSRRRDIGQHAAARTFRRSLLAARRLRSHAALAVLCPALGLVGVALLHLCSPLADAAGLLALGLALTVAIAAIITLPESRP